VYAEVAPGTGEFRYLIIVTRDGSKVISIVDRRPAAMTREERQARVTTLLQDAGWAFLSDNEVDTREQAAALGDYWLKVRAVGDADRVAAEGVAGAAWKTDRGELLKGVKDLAELERATLRLAKEKREGKGWTWPWSSSGGGGAAAAEPARA
jgi:hypothetical protein